MTKRFPVLAAGFFMLIYILSGCSGKNIYYLKQGSGSRTISGLEVFIKSQARHYKDKNAVLITNHSGSDFNLKSNLTLLKEKKINILHVVAPEHGLYGYQNVYDTKNSYVDSHHQIRVYNMHKLNHNQLVNLFKDAELVIYDIQDMGMRCYTYISNLKETIDALHGLGVQLIVLDRPNPIDFLGIDGAFLDGRFFSRFISSFPAPFIYGLTPGEASLYYSKEFKKDVPIKVVRMKNYYKSRMFNQTRLPWIPPSPNLPTFESSIVYTAVVMFEGLNISIGRGTAKPFEYIGAPWIDPEQFAEELNALGLKNFRFKPVYFEPFMREYTGQRCGGVQIFYTGGKFSPTEAAYKITALLFKINQQTKWKIQGGTYSVDFLAGTDLFRKYIDKGKSWKEYKQAIEPELKRFRSVKRKYHLY